MVTAIPFLYTKLHFNIKVKGKVFPVQVVEALRVARG
jgi:hypothetical protein